jgi:hypothetical protein
MLVFAKEKLVFLAMPKTGTTALEAALAPRSDMVMRNPPILKHMPAYRYNRFLVPYLEKCGLEDMKLICVVRHPIGWLGSWYRYRQRADVDGHPHSTKTITFDDFVNEYAKGEPAGWANVGSPTKFLRRGSGEVIVDHLFQYEQMDKLVSFFEDRLNFKITLKHRNVSPDGDLTLSEKTESKLLRKRPEMYSDWNAAKR